jgi:hypothetical protein
MENIDITREQSSVNKAKNTEGRGFGSVQKGTSNTRSKSSQPVHKKANYEETGNNKKTVSIVK